MSLQRSGPRLRIETKVTVYSKRDARRKVATLTRIAYSDGRKFKNARYHNGHSFESLVAQLESQLGSKVCLDAAGFLP